MHDIHTRKDHYKTFPRVIVFDGVRVHHQPLLANLVRGFSVAMGRRPFPTFVGVTSLKKTSKDRGRKVGGYTLMYKGWAIILLDPWATEDWGRTAYALAHEAGHVARRNRGRNGGHDAAFKRLVAKIGQDGT